MYNNEKIPVIIDCDPGHDDMVALVLALGNENIDVKAITNVAGNKVMSKVVKNTLNILNWCGAETEVAPGAECPLIRKYTRKDTDGCHGLTGLDGFEFPEENPLKPSGRRAIEAMADIVRRSDRKVTIITTGPLTNLGLFLRAFPDLHKNIEQISIMGGTCHFILTQPFMEFNTYLDAEATKIVFESGIPITMFGYDVTYSVLFKKNFTERLLNTGTRTGLMVSKLLDEFTVLHNKRWIDLGGCPVHDACAVAGVIDPSIVTKSEMMYVEIQTEPGPLSGATICDYQHRSGMKPNIKVVLEMDSEKFFDLVVASAANLK
ncbi:MAG: nucleoside hydrolase [Oscillospiraceae bacterium]